MTGGLAAPATPAYALDDGLARTPPMGFNNWNSTHCRPEFNESMVKGIADIFVSKGLKDAGYTYVNLDDCWALPQRDAQGNLVPDPARFPNGIKAVADYVHAKGLKFGIYTSAGTKTCNSAGFPGGLGHETTDANLFASWGVDYLKYDNCNNQGVDAVQRYTTMRDALKATGRPIVFSICEWGQNKPWLWAKDVGHLWRTTGDISDNYSSMLTIAKANMALAPYAGPGHWNDPDMLEVGNGGMTDVEYRSHVSLWSIMAAPLLIGTDLRTASPRTFELLTDKEVIAVDQDPLGVQGSLLRGDGGRDVLVKPLANGDRAVVLFNEADTAQRISTSAAELGMPKAPGYALRDLWAHTTTHTVGTIAATVPAHGSVMYRVSTDRRWATYPPTVDFGPETTRPYPGATPLAVPGTPTTVTTTATDLGIAPVLDVTAGLTGPAGWQVRASSRRETPVLPGRDRTFATTWEVTAPAGSAPGRYDLAGTLTYRRATDLRPVTTIVTTSVVVPPPAPAAGTSYLSDLTWLSVANGYGPAERDTSNGEMKAGDGHPITIGGTVYAKGLGVHAPSTVAYFAGARCTTVTAFVGVDDEKQTNGSVTFEVWADGRKVADSGLLTTDLAAVPLSADVTGATVVRLVVTDGGDGINSDHADWADAKIACA
ncbi:NPCBM/NEW2 domain-containing protein [Planosporangium sp. 12N6]|uniref:NPCBM/NEW2 domain-containing protein n=1 Tax=Planosporangium spinosum TaxID=3402278 RepID=UPI003CF981BE